ncbi:MAG: hypothetical protein ACP5MB_08930, partial [bacterium]
MNKKIMLLSIIIMLLILGSIQGLVVQTHATSNNEVYKKPAVLLQNALWIGNVSTSYNDNVYIPVYSSSNGTFEKISIILAYNPNILSFKDVLSNPASQYANFSSKTLAKGIVRISGSGKFLVINRNTVVFYVDFEPLVNENTLTNVILTEYSIDEQTYYSRCQAYIELVSGWINIGPQSINWGTGIESSLSGTLSDIGFSPYNMDLIYVTSGAGGPHHSPGDRASQVVGAGGVFVSEDGGRTWEVENLGLNSTSVESIVVDPNDPEIAVIETRGISMPIGGAIYKTINGGKSWQETYPVGGYSMQYINGTLYAATFYSILKSNDFGTTWNTIYSVPDFSMGAFRPIITAATFTDNGRVIYLGLWYPQPTNLTSSFVTILRSTDGGLTFKTLFNLTRPTTTVDQILINQSNPNIIWALVDGGLTYPNIFITRDGGGSWSLLNFTKAGIKIPADTWTTSYPLYYYPQYIIIDPQNSSIVYLGGDGYLYRSTDGGINFKWVMGFDQRFIYIDPLNDSIIFDGTDQGLFYSLNGGRTWMDMNNRSANMIYDAAVDGLNVFGTVQDFAPMYSPDGGRNWTVINNGELGLVTVDPYNRSIVVMWTEQHAAGPFFFVSHNSGSSFFLPSINYTEMANDLAGLEGVGFSRNGYIYVTGGYGILVSRDSGKTFSLINGSPKQTFFIVPSPTNSNVLYTGDWYGLYMSNDSGLSWEKINDGIFDSIAIDPLNSSIIIGSKYYSDRYGVTEMGQLFISYDGGRNFQELPMSSISAQTGITGMFPTGSIISNPINITYSAPFQRFTTPPQVYFFVVNDRAVAFYTCGSGVFESYDLGKSWINLNFNLPETQVNSFQLVNETGVIATYGNGIWIFKNITNLAYQKETPVAVVYLGKNASLNKTVSGPGYYLINLNVGKNSFVVKINGTIFYEFLYAKNGFAYFANLSTGSFSDLTVIPENLPGGLGFKFSIDNETFTLGGSNLTLQLEPGSYQYTVTPTYSDYEIYYPDETEGFENVSFFGSSIYIGFKHSELQNTDNLSTSIGGLVSRLAYYDGYLIKLSFGAELMNTKTSQTIQLNSKYLDGFLQTVTPYRDGLLFGGSREALNENLPVLVYYDLKTGTYVNLTRVLPGYADVSPSAVQALLTLDNGDIVILGYANNRTIFGLINGTEFYDLSSIIPNYFAYPYGRQGWTGAYIPASNEIIIGNLNNGFLGIINMTSYRFYDVSYVLPIYAYLGNGPAGMGLYSFDFMASNNNSAIILGSLSNGSRIVYLYEDGEFKDISGLFPSSCLYQAATWDGQSYLLGGYTYNGSMALAAFDPYSYKVSEISTPDVPSGSQIFTVAAGSPFTFYYSYTVPYVYYLTNTESVEQRGAGEVNILLNANSGNLTVNGSVYNFRNNVLNLILWNGSYKAKISSPGFLNMTIIINVKAFRSSTVYVGLKKVYSITFTESGLPLKTQWSVTLNGSTKSSNASYIIFDVPAGSYVYSVGTVSGYSVSPSSGTLTVRSNSSQEITFSQLEAVTFTESGLPAGASWSVTLNGTTKSSNSSTIVFQEPIGMYTYTVGSVSGYTISPGSGTINVTGNEQIAMSFKPVLYAITF